MTLVLSFLCLICLVYGAVELQSGLSKLKKLKNLNLSEKAIEPVSIIIVAKDEEKHIENAIYRLLKQTYQKIEIIIVDDRSCDKTPQLINKIKQKHRQIQIKTIKNLPKGWLGKNHAMYEGAKLATSNWILFLDADVLLDKSVISLAMSYVQQQNISNLTLIPEFKTQRFWLDMIICSGSLAFYYKLKPWRCRQPSKKFYFGIGAFNLLKRNDYFDFNGHQSFPMCILDDMKLAQKLKENNAVQHCLDGFGLISINWYESIGDIMQGTEKNSFAYCQFKLSKLIIESTLGLYLFIWPLAGIFFSNPYVKCINLVSILITIMIYGLYCHLIEASKWHKFLYPFGIIVGTYSWWRAAVKILYHGGVYWRDTFYSIAKLRDDLL